MNFRRRFKLILLAFCCLISIRMKSQAPPFAVPYQAVARNAAGIIIPNQLINVKVGVYSVSPSGILEWEETDTTHTDFFGHFVINIGRGISTSLGSLSSFSSINWGNSAHYFNIQIDFSGGGTFINMGTSQLLSVPYAMYSQKTRILSSLPINNLTDVDTAGIQIGYLLKWNGNNWIPQVDNHRDTVSFASYSNHSVHADTSLYALSLHALADTVLFANNAGNANYSGSSQAANNVLNCPLSDIATYALSAAPLNVWNINGNNCNNSNNTIGTNDSTDFVAKTRNVERFRLRAAGRTSFGLSSSNADVHFLCNNGFLEIGNFGSGDTTVTYIPDAKMMWYPRRGAFRAGIVTGNQWNNYKMGDYSIAGGYNTTASGIYSVAFGNATSALCENCVSFGKNSTTNITHGAISQGGSVAMGDSCAVTYTRSMAFGDHCFSDGGYALGSRNTTGFGTSVVFGTKNNGTVASNIFGTYASSNSFSGCFIYSDSSSSTVRAVPNANNQFIVRASGGIIFYTNSALSNGVQLFQGGGSWASASDRKKKENFADVDGEEVLAKLEKMKIFSWNYISQPAEIRHVGPFAQDFYRAFKLGDSRRSINMADIDGVNLVAVKALYARTKLLTNKYNSISEIKAEADEINTKQQSLDKRLEKLEATLKQN